MNFMKGKIFTDTNILIYARDLGSGFKHETAASIVEE